MTHRTFSPHALSTVLLVLPLLTIGCDNMPSDRRCFAWTKGEGACPAQADAIDFFLDSASCPPPVRSVNSEGEFLGDRCCYEVDGAKHSDPECIPGADAPPGFPSGGGIGEPPGSGCFSCSAQVHRLLNGGLMVPAPCWGSPESETLWNAVQDCLCAGACQSACSSSSCALQTPTAACAECAGDAAVGCGDALSTCMNDL